ncbi:MAG: very short patch repair endonuclease [Elusimicrobia bacterium RIFOXYB2_FULL_50_12]|nr:MAG: very short patch repair endonuclease [Elusimicrobia bacterium RIFOXYB2_FULL_50_12]
MDILSREKRSWNMSRIRSRNTTPERIVRSVLHELGYRFRLKGKKLFGNPDIILPKYKTAIFVHGCFWHRHKGCKSAYIPKTRVEFWKKKFRDNVKRDKKVAATLTEEGWKVAVIWEDETKDTEKLKKILKLRFKKTAKCKVIYDALQ